MTQKELERLLATITAMKRRNHSLTTLLSQARKSRDQWRERALTRTKTIENLRMKIKRRDHPLRESWSPEIKFTQEELNWIRSLRR